MIFNPFCICKTVSSVITRAVSFFFFNIYLFGCVWSQLRHVGSFIAAHRFSSCGTWVYWFMACGIISASQPDGTHVPCIARRILNHWTTWEVPKGYFLFIFIFQCLGQGLTKGHLSFDFSVCQIKWQCRDTLHPQRQPAPLNNSDKIPSLQRIKICFACSCLCYGEKTTKQVLSH